MAGASTTAHCARAVGTPRIEAPSNAIGRQSLRLCMTTPSMFVCGQKLRQPSRRVSAGGGNNPMHALNLLGAPGNHRQFAVESLQVQLTNHAVMRLLDQKHARSG